MGVFFFLPYAVPCCKIIIIAGNYYNALYIKMFTVQCTYKVVQINDDIMLQQELGEYFLFNEYSHTDGERGGVW